MGTRLTLRAPEDYRLARDYCSYGYFLLSPNHWDPSSQTVSRVLDLDEGPVRVRMRQEERVGSTTGAGGAVLARCDRALSRDEQRDARAQLTRMLRLDEPSEAIRAFHRVDPRWRRSGRGRLMRSPTVFEDVIKTVTSCNVAWPSTVVMNTRLCEVIGRGGAFPSAEKLARTRPSTLRARCRAGYRDSRIVELAKLLRPRGAKPAEIDPAWLEDTATSDEDVRATLLALPGIGPYAASNIMQLLGRYAHLPLDSESVRHGKTVLGMSGSDASIMKQVAAHFEPFGEHRFRSYWFELWRHYESKQGPATAWERETTASAFTASQL